MGGRHGPCYPFKNKGWNRALIPLFLSLGAFITGIMALFVGRTWNIMEDYEILLLNTSSITDWGKTHFHTKTSTTASLHLDIRKIKVADDSEDELNDDRLKDNTNLPKREGPPYDFYSLHGTGICMGWFLPRPDDPAPHREVQNCITGYFTDDGLDLYDLLVKHTNGAIEAFTDAGNVKANLKTLYGAHKTFTLMFTIAVGVYGIFGFFTTWFAIYNPLRHKRAKSDRHKIIIWSHWIASIICGMLGLLSGIVGLGMGNVAAAQIQQHWANYDITATTGSKWLPVLWTSVGMMMLVWVWWNWMWMRLLGLRVIWCCVKDRGDFGDEDTESDDERGSFDMHEKFVGPLRGRSPSPRRWQGPPAGGMPMHSMSPAGPGGFSMPPGPPPRPPYQHPGMPPLMRPPMGPPPPPGFMR